MKKLLCAMMILVAARGFGGGRESSTPLESGAMELGLNAGLDFQSPHGDVAGQLDGRWGYFVMDNIELGGVVSLANSKDYGHAGTGFGLGPYAELNFDLDIMPVMPYIGIQIKYNAGDYWPHDHLNVEGAAGLKFFLIETTAIAAELYYDLASQKVYNNDDSLKSTDAGARLGLRFYF